MLIVKNLKKTYKAKGGQEVKALDDVSVAFPATGMTFLLGKSGSGKSTLLNVIGGLDKADSGEIIIKGRNSKTFSGADFDSYRNTYIGFIFQEYNILNEFNIEQNVALALQLQGKPNDRKAVQEILEKVDLNDPAILKRKPNTLSGGQKQRIAIARALIKNPEIIMADEPTGALDSKTGKQVFDTLKKLSKEKLVIVVSHDRDFAEIYGDRIIELSDGKIISDVSKEYVEPKNLNENINLVNNHTIAIKDTSKLTDADVKSILAQLKSQKGEAVISSGAHDVPLVKQAIRINTDNTTEVFNNTKSVTVKKYDGSQTKFIRSRLPASRAMKMGASSIGQKPIRLIFTTLLTVVALTMFGLTSCLMMFKEAYSVSKALQASDLDTEVLSKNAYYTESYYQYNNKTGEVSLQSSYTNTYSPPQVLFGVEEVNRLNNNNLGHKFAGIFTFRDSQYSYGESNYVATPSNSSLDTSKLDSYYSYYRIAGLMDPGASYFENNSRLSLNGTYPQNPDEIALSNYQFEVFKKANPAITSESDLIGKTIKYSVSGNRDSKNLNLKVTGIFNAGTIKDKYDKLKEGQGEDLSAKQRESLEKDFDNFMKSSFFTYAFVSEDFYETYKTALYNDKNQSYVEVPHTDAGGLRISESEFGPDESVSEESMNQFVISELVKDNVKYYWFDADGNQTTYQQEAETEIYLPYSMYLNSLRNRYTDYFQELSNFLSNLQYNREDFIKYCPSAASFSVEEIMDYQNFVGTARWNASSKEELDAAVEAVAPMVALWKEYMTNYEYLPAALSNYQNYIYHKYDYSEEQITDNGTANEKRVYFELCDEICNNQNYAHVSEAINIIKSVALEIFTYQCGIHGLEDDVPTDIYNIYNKARTDYENKTVTVTESEMNYFYDWAKNSQGYEWSYRKFTDDPAMPEIATESEVIKKYYYLDYFGNRGQLTVKGFYSTGGDSWGMPIFNVAFLRRHSKLSDSTYFNKTTTKYVAPEDAKYNYVITKSSFGENQISQFLTKGAGFTYKMTDSVYANISMALSLITTLKQIFLIIGAVSAVFAALMLLNFISTSIASKTKEIGILRAVGARGSDLFKIFFSESGIIAGICAVLSIIASAIVAWRLNVSMSQTVIGIQMLDFGFINVLLILAGAVLIALIGTLLPVIIAAKKPPVDSIRAL